MGFGYIAAGIFFLFNPNLHVLDILPDFIGILLVYRGLFMMSFSTEKLRDARTSLWKLAIITAFRALSVLFLPGKSDSFIMLLVFTFGVLEALYAIPAIVSIFDGLYDLGRLYDAQSVYNASVNRRGASVERAEKLKVFTIIFFLIKTVAAVLPELTALALTNDLSANAQLGVSLSMFKPYFYFLSVTVTLIFGVIWFVRMQKYVGRMRHDENLRRGIAGYYHDNIAADEGVSAALSMKHVLLLFTLAVVAVFPLQFDGVFVFPSAIAALILAWAFRILARFEKRASFGYIPAALAGVLSIVNLSLQIPYFSEYEAEAALHLNNAIRLYKPIRFLGTIEFIVVLVMFVWLVFILCRVFRQHVELIGGGTYGLQYTAAARNREIFAGVRVRFAAAGTVGAAYFILRAISFTAAMYYNTFWLIHTAAAIVFVVCAVYAVSGASDMIYERLENKY